MSLWSVSKSLSHCTFWKSFGKSAYFKYIECHILKTSFIRFRHLWLRYHILIFSSTCVNFKPDSKQISAENPMFVSSENQRWTTLIQSWSALKQRSSVLMFFTFFESTLKSTEKCQIYSALIISGTSMRIIFFNYCAITKLLPYKAVMQPGRLLAFRNSWWADFQKFWKNWQKQS